MSPIYIYIFNSKSTSYLLGFLHSFLFIQCFEAEILYHSFVCYSTSCLRTLSCALCVKTCTVLLEFLARQCNVIHYALKINSTSWPFQEKLQYFLIPECNIVLRRYQCDKINVSFSNVNQSALHLYKSLGGYLKPPDKKGQLGYCRSAFLNAQSQSTGDKLQPVLKRMARIFRSEQTVDFYVVQFRIVLKNFWTISKYMFCYHLKRNKQKQNNKKHNPTKHFYPQ